MKTIFLLLSLLAAGQAMAVQSVSGYYRSSGTYVQPHYRTSPNSTLFDNYTCFFGQL